MARCLGLRGSHSLDLVEKDLLHFNAVAVSCKHRCPPACHISSGGSYSWGRLALWHLQTWFCTSHNVRSRPWVCPDGLVRDMVPRPTGSPGGGSEGQSSHVNNKCHTKMRPHIFSTPFHPHHEPIIIIIYM